MTDYREQVRAAIRATTIHSTTGYSWFGKRSPRVPRSVRSALTPQTARGYLLFSLQSQLYNDFYCTGLARPARPGRADRATAVRTPYVEALAAANSGRGYWTRGWEVHGSGDGELLVRRNGLTVRVRPEECRSGSGGAPGGAAVVSLRFPKDSLVVSPGFYMSFGDEELVQEGSQPLVRWYWNLTPRGAIGLLRSASLLLNRAALPHKLKVVSDPARFTRCDAGVLYVRRADHRAVAGIVAEVYAEVAGDIRPAVPVFTKRMAPGLGLAEDPGQGESFGLHRCGLLAEGMVRTREQGRGSRQDGLEGVESAFAEEGITLDEPFLNPGSVDDYVLPTAPAHLPRRSRAPGADRSAPGRTDFLQTAAGIGRRLCREAVWHEGRCSWMGAEAGGHADDGAIRVACRSLGPALYAGTSGVGLFLAELHHATGDTDARDTAVGAIRQSLSALDAVPPSVRLGLYTGWSGIAMGAVRVGVRLREDELVAGAQHVLECLAGLALEDRELDLLGGIAGAVAALVALRDILDDEWLLDVAKRLGDQLLGAAEKTPSGYSWRSLAFPHQPNLTGFSHGAAGVGHALLELFDATRDARYREAAEQAFAYERGWFRPEAGNWPDLRAEPGRRSRTGSAHSFTAAWCHGAPGIALSRLRACQILGDDRSEAEARVALQTTREAVQRGLEEETGTYTLCHGLAGNADVLLLGDRMLRERGGGGGTWLATWAAPVSSGTIGEVRSGLAGPRARRPA